jgi:kynurenine formamidase
MAEECEIRTDVTLPPYRRSSGEERGVAVDVDVEALGRKLCNWSTWGADDQVGTVNYITPAATARAAQLARTGQVFGLGIAMDRNGPAIGSALRFNPLHFMSIIPTEKLRAGEVGIADDVLFLPLQSATQWDSLAHVSFRGQLYGGRPASLVSTDGASVNDICNVASKVATRGVLLDIARSWSVEALEPGVAIEAADLDEALAATGLEVGEGDAVLVRTGYLNRCRRQGWQGYSATTPGLGMSTLEWFAERHVAVVATDTYAVEVKPYQVADQASPFHVVALVYMGLLLGEIFDLDALAAACAADGGYEFFFVGPGLPVTAGVGSPVNAFAIK